jgi:hypothetical protein
VEWRFVEGGFTGAPNGRARLWTRVRIPLVAGEETAPLHRLMVVADSTNGVSARLPIQEWWSIPNTLTVTVERLPTEEWMWLEAATDISPRPRRRTRGVVRPRRGARSRRAAAAGEPSLI